MAQVAAELMQINQMLVAVLMALTILMKMMRKELLKSQSV